jgi:5,6-dimethylbenzimidazole synthase
LIIAILCLGPADTFYDQPMLQAEKWARRADLTDMLFEDAWGQACV